MLKNLLESNIDRQNILNNPFALEKIEEEVKNFSYFEMENKIFILKQDVAKFYEVDERTLERAVSENEQELRQNGYKILTGERLKIAKSLYVSDKNVGDLRDSKFAGSWGVFDFRSFLNIGMLLTNSKVAGRLRSKILDIVIGVMNEKLGQNRKYVNQKDPLYSFTFGKYQDYHQELNNSLRDYLEMGNTKYIYFNDKIYQFLFLERYKEYKILLNLKGKEKPIQTHYSEVITTISTFETAFAEEIKDKSRELERKLSKIDTETVFNKLISKKMWEPLLGFSREIIASRDLVFRQILHPNLADNIRELSMEEYQKFISKKPLSNPLYPEEEKQFLENRTQDLFAGDIDILIRMKNK